jgi:hypothetical protein
MAALTPCSHSLGLQEQQPQNAELTSSDASVDAFTKAHVLVKYLTDALQFTTQLHSAVPVVSQLLGSKTASDIIEAVGFFKTATLFSLDSAMDGVRRMLALVWSKDTDIRNSVMTTYQELYFSADKAIYTTAKVGCFSFSPICSNCYKRLQLCRLEPVLLSRT